MIITKTELQDVMLLNFNIFRDIRGQFSRTFCWEKLQSNKLHFIIKQSNLSINIKKGTLRGFHFQKKGFEEKKSVTCIKGEIFNVVVDLRKKSKTYIKWQSFKLNEKNKTVLLLPKGCANAFLTLKENTIVLYHHSKIYNQKGDTGFKYNDKLFNINWPIKPIVISKKDKNFESLKI